MLILSYVVAFGAWLALRPGSPALFTAVDLLAQCAGPLLALPLCLGGDGEPWWRPWLSWRPWRSWRGATTTARHWAPPLVALAILSHAVEQIIWTFGVLILHRMFLWADAFDLCSYIFFLLAILLLPARPLLAVIRTRVALDSMVTIASLVTFSWYFLIGPALLHAHATTFAKVEAVAYPFTDLVLAVCLIRLIAHSGHGVAPSIVRLMSLMLGIVIATHSISDYQVLHANAGGAAGTPSVLLDMNVPCAMLLAGLAARRLGRMATAAAGSAGRGAPSAGEGAPLPALWRALLPYALVPAVCALLVYTWRRHGLAPLTLGVEIGSAVLIGLVLSRQVVALLDNRRLYHQVAAAYVQLQAMATTDPLTNLPNHRALVGMLDHELERVDRQGRPCAVLILDIDHFKALNDGYGHLAGDAALRELAAVARVALRSADTLGRWGGEEFVAILPDVDRQGALIAAEHVRARIADHAFVTCGGARLTCSIGVAAYPRDAPERDGLIAAADQALYAAKRLGRDKVCRAGDDAVAALAARNAVESREETAQAGMADALTALAEVHDAGVGRRADDVAALAARVALTLGLDPAQARMIGLAGRLRDIGDIGVLNAIPRGPEPLDLEEVTALQAHPATGAGIVEKAPALRPLAPMIRAHHERWDGAGYPDALSGQAIPLGARIIAAADAYVAMTSGRPYRPARDGTSALDELRRHAGTQLDPAVVAALERTLATGSSPRRRAGAA